MKRDLELVREILLGAEAHPEGSGWIDFHINDYSPEEIAYHVKIMAQGGLVEATDVSSSGDFDWRATSLTWEGHEFLDAARNDTRWRKILPLVKDEGASIPFEVVKELLLQWARSAASS